MARLFSIAYVDRLLNGETYHDLVELSQTMVASPRFNLENLDYGLPAFAFLFVETLTWFAQAIRSRVWTYYESTPAARMQLMRLALSDHAPIGFSDWYTQGMADWQEPTRICAVDRWIRENDDDANRWLRQLARTNRKALLAIT